jgi:hypothetical protein
MSIDPPEADRIKEFFLFVKKSRAKRHPQFVNHHSSFHEVSYERRRWPEKRPV